MITIHPRQGLYKCSAYGYGGSKFHGGVRIDAVLAREKRGDSGFI